MGKDLKKILNEQVNKRTNLSSVTTHCNFVDLPRELVCRVTMLLDESTEIVDMVSECLKNLSYPFEVRLDAYYLSMTSTEEFYLFHPSKSSALNLGVFDNDEDLENSLDKNVGTNDHFIESLINHHEQVLARDGKPIFRESNFTFVGLVSIELYLRYSIEYTKNSRHTV